jgi:cell division protein FtsN
LRDAAATGQRLLDEYQMLLNRELSSQSSSSSTTPGLLSLLPTVLIAIIIDYVSMVAGPWPKSMRSRAQEELWHVPTRNWSPPIEAIGQSISSKSPLEIVQLTSNEVFPQAKSVAKLSNDQFERAKLASNAAPLLIGYVEVDD